MSGQQLKISTVEGRQLGAASDGHRRNHAIGEAPGATARLVEKTRGERGIGGEEWLGLREYLSSECLARCVNRSTQEFRPRDGADIDDLRSRCP